MRLNFIKLSPTQNMTILVTDPVPRDRQIHIANRLMAYDGVFAEQVGYLERAENPACRVRLQMMGGEFCGNAAMSMGAYLAMGDDLADGEARTYPIEVSGTEGAVACRILRQGEDFIGTVDMPLPRYMKHVNFDGTTVPVIFFDGIAHAIVDKRNMRREDAAQHIALWCDQIGAEALGILLTEGAEIEPLVYVRAAGSRVWERGCGSGSAAMGAYRALTDKKDADIEIAQPGGRIRVQAEIDGAAVARIRITGRVKVVCEGIAYI